MKIVVNKKRAVIAAVNAVSLTGALILSLIGSGAAKSQQYNYAAERWQSSDKNSEYAQISCFLSESAGFTTDSLGSIRSEALSELQTVAIVPEEGKRLCPDAYSATVGNLEVRGDISGFSESEITAVGGDFFLIHNFKLIDGAFFTENDTMQDGAVIDRDLAWALYGSYHVSGMKMTINGSQYYISGVIENVQTDEEKKCSGELPRAYISYDGAANFAAYSGEYGSDGGYESTKFDAITCYEVLMPNPVENFAYKTVEKSMGSYENNVAVVQNTDRFNSSKRVKALKKISSIAVRDNPIAYPYWENASRMVEFRLSYVYMCQRLFLVIPFATLIGLIIIAFRALKRNKKNIFRAFSSFFIKVRNKIKTKGSANTNEQKD